MNHEAWDTVEGFWDILKLRFFQNIFLKTISDYYFFNAIRPKAIFVPDFMLIVRVNQNFEGLIAENLNISAIPLRHLQDLFPQGYHFSTSGAFLKISFKLFFNLGGRFVTLRRTIRVDWKFDRTVAELNNFSHPLYWFHYSFHYH